MCLDEKYSTTRLLTADKPVIENKDGDKVQSVLFLPEGVNRKGEGGLRTQGYFKHTTKDKPLITVVTVVFNGEAFLEETILSVINQTYDNVEYIIIDGGSTDGTLDIIRKYDHAIDYWVSEEDEGIYDAMNKGIVTSVGQIIGILNADDFYSLDALAVSGAAISNKKADFSYGKVYLVKESGEIYGETRPLNNTEIKKRIFKEMPYPHPSVFVTKAVYKKVGLFDVTYKLSADYEFLLRMYTSKYHGVDTSKYISYFRSGGRSGGLQTFRETRLIIIRYGVNLLLANWLFISSLSKSMACGIFPSFVINFIQSKRKTKHSIWS